MTWSVARTLVVTALLAVALSRAVPGASSATVPGSVGDSNDDADLRAIRAANDALERTLEPIGADLSTSAAREARRARFREVHADVQPRAAMQLANLERERDALRKRLAADASRLNALQRDRAAAMAEAEHWRRVAELAEKREQAEHERAEQEAVHREREALARAAEREHEVEEEARQWRAQLEQAAEGQLAAARNATARAQHRLTIELRKEQRIEARMRQWEAEANRAVKAAHMHAERRESDVAREHAAAMRQAAQNSAWREAAVKAVRLLVNHTKLEESAASIDPEEYAAAARAAVNDSSLQQLLAAIEPQEAWGDARFAHAAAGTEAGASVNEQPQDPQDFLHSLTLAYKRLRLLKLARQLRQRRAAAQPDMGSTSLQAELQALERSLETPAAGVGSGVGGGGAVPLELLQQPAAARAAVAAPAIADTPALPRTSLDVEFGEVPDPMAGSFDAAEGDVAAADVMQASPFAGMPRFAAPPAEALLVPAALPAALPAVVPRPMDASELVDLEFRRIQAEMAAESRARARDGKRRA